MLYTLFIKLLLNSLGVFVTARILKGVEIKGFVPTIMTALILSLINIFIKPVVSFFFTPINFLTLGLFSFVIDGFLILLVSAAYPYFKVKNFYWAMVFSILLSIINALLHLFFI